MLDVTPQWCSERTSMTSEQVTRIGNRHVARCLDKIADVHVLPQICQDTIIREIHFTAKDVAELAKQGDTSDDTRGNR